MNVTVVSKKTKAGPRYYVRVELGRDPVTGRPIQKQEPGGYRTKTEAKKVAREVAARIDRAAYREPSKTTTAEYLEAWITAAAGNGRIRPGTASLYETVRRAYIVPRIGHLTLQALRAQHLDAAYADLLARGGRGEGPLAPKTVRHAHTLLHKALSDAVKKGLITTNPAAVADSPRPRRQEMKTWTAQELGGFLHHAHDDRLFAAWRLVAMTGMRRGEVLGLRWKDVDLERGRLSITQTLVLIDNKPQVSTPKTESGRRSIALDGETVSALKAHRAAMAQERLALGLGLTADDLLFTSVDGTPLHPDWFGRTFVRLAKAAGLPVIRLHDLRHTFATLALDAGVKVWDVSDILGHANISITLDLYRHAVPNTQAEATTKVATLLRS